MTEKQSPECGRIYISALKTQKLPGPLTGTCSLAVDSSLQLCDSTPLRQQLLPPPLPNPGSAPESVRVYRPKTGVSVAS